LVWLVARDVSSRPARFLKVGLALLFAAVMVDLGTPLTEGIELDGVGWPQAIRLTLEEALEVCGWVLVSGTMTALLCLALVGSRDAK